MAVDLKCDGSGGGEHATKLKNETSCIVGKRSANVKCSHALGKDAAQLRTFSQSAIDPECNLSRKYEEVRSDKPHNQYPLLPNRSKVLWVVMVFDLCQNATYCP